MSSVSAVRTAPPAQCCDQIGEAFGRCWTWIKDTWHWCVDKLVHATNAVAFGFFRVFECFAPKLALRMEAAYGYFATWYANYSAAVAQEISETTIADLEVVNRGLNREVLDRAGDLSALQVAQNRTLSENNRLLAGRNADIEARVRSEGQHLQMKQFAGLSEARAAVLGVENQRVQEQLQVSIAERAPILAENRSLGDTVSDLRTENAYLQVGIKHAIEERDLAFGSMQLWQTLRVQSEKKPPSVLNILISGFGKTPKGILV